MQATGEDGEGGRIGLSIPEAGVIAALAIAEVAGRGVTAVSLIGTKSHGKSGRRSISSSLTSIGSWRAVAHGSITVAVQKPVNVGGGIAVANGCCSWVNRTRKMD